MKKSLTLGFVTLTLLFSACKKSADLAPSPSFSSSGNAVQYFQLPGEIADYLKLAVNGYFIYKDSATGQIDSVVVKESSIEKMFAPGGISSHQDMDSSPLDAITNAPYHDNLILRMSTESAGLSVPWLTINYAANGSATIDLVNEDPSSGATSVFWYPVTTRYLNTDERGGFGIPFMEVEGITYTDVYRFVFSTAIGKSDYYWAKGIGVIKRTIIANGEVQTQTLLRKG